VCSSDLLALLSLAALALLAIVVALPASYVVSSGWNKKIVEAEGKRVSAEESKVKGKDLSYTIQAVLPGQEAVKVRAAPNEKMIEWFAQQIEAEQAQARSVADAGEAFNRQGRMALVEGLFPEPADEDAKQLKPMVIFYKYNPILFGLVGSWLLVTEFYTLPNLVAGREIVPELVPHFGDETAIVEAADKLIRSPEAAQAQRDALSALVDQFKGKRASELAADAILKMAGLCPSAD